MLSGKLPVFPDEVGRTIVSIRKIAGFPGRGCQLNDKSSMKSTVFKDE